MTNPIERPKAPYVPPTSTPSVQDVVVGPQAEVGPTAEDFQQIGASFFKHPGAQDPAMGGASAITANKAGETLEEFSAYEGNISDLLASMATTMAGIFQKLRKNALDGKVAELKTQVQAMEGQAGKMRDAADNNYNAALIQGWTQFAGGAVGLAGGAVAVHASFKAGKEIKAQQSAAAAPTAKASDAVDETSGFDDLMAQAGNGRARANAFKGERPAHDAADAAAAGESASAPAMPAAPSGAHVELLNARARLATDLSQSMGSVVTALGGVFSAGQKHEADLNEAQGKELEAQATQAAADLAREDEAVQMWKEAGQRLLDNLKAAFDQEQASAKATIQNI